MKNRSRIIKSSEVLLLILLMFVTFGSTVHAKGNEIQVYDAQLSEKVILKNTVVDIYATLANLGNKSILVHSLNAEFIAVNASVKNDRVYTHIYDKDHREIGPGDSITGSMKIKVVNPEGTYNVRIFFKATDVYSSDNPLGEAPVLNYTTCYNVTVKIYDKANITGIVAGIGFTFMGIVGVLGLVLFYGWIKDRINKKKYA